MKTDSIFYRFFQELPSIFFELIGNSAQTAAAYEFSSVEIKQTAFRIDGVFLTSQVENPIYFVEVQFQPDTEIYSRLFSEIFLYIRQYKPLNPWQAVVIYPTRNVDTADRSHHAELLDSHRAQVIYLDEIGETASLPVGIATMRLVIENQDTAITTARELINRTRQEIDTETKQHQLLELIETILVYKFPSMSRKEIESMFSLSDLQQTKVYQEAKQEGIQEGRQEGARQEKLRLIPLLLKLGLSVEQIAQELNLQLEEVQQELQKQFPNPDN